MAIPKNHHFRVPLLWQRLTALDLLMSYGGMDSLVVAQVYKAGAHTWFSGWKEPSIRKTFTNSRGTVD